MDWNVTVVSPPTGVLVTDDTPGGLNIVTPVMLSIHSATGEKCAVPGNDPLTVVLKEPMAPAAIAAPGVVALAAPAAVVDADPLVPAKLVTSSPAGVLASSCDRTVPQSTVPVEIVLAWALVVLTSFDAARAESKVGISALNWRTLAVRVFTLLLALRTDR